jgi:hypothetical protein
VALFAIERFRAKSVVFDGKISRKGRWFREDFLIDGANRTIHGTDELKKGSKMLKHFQSLLILRDRETL